MKEKICLICNLKFNDESKNHLKKYCSSNCFKINQKNYNKNYKKLKPDKIKILNKKYKYNNKEKINLKAKLYREKNKEKDKLRHKLYYMNNREKINTYMRESRKNNLIKVKANLRRRTHHYLIRSNLKKIKSFDNYIGCSQDYLIKYLEKQFKIDMDWENYGKLWNIDHIIPLSSAKTENELYILCHYRNLQPLYVMENLLKRDKFLNN